MHERGRGVLFLQRLLRADVPWEAAAPEAKSRQGRAPVRADAWVVGGAGSRSPEDAAGARSASSLAAAARCMEDRAQLSKPSLRGMRCSVAAAMSRKSAQGSCKPLHMDILQPFRGYRCETSQELLSRM